MFLLRYEAFVRREAPTRVVTRRRSQQQRDRRVSEMLRGKRGLDEKKGRRKSALATEQVDRLVSLAQEKPAPNWTNHRRSRLKIWGRGKRQKE